MQFQFGTCYFVSKRAAMRYYIRQNPHTTMIDVERKLAGGEIHIGRPPLKTGQRLAVIDRHTRYAIIER